MTSGKRTKANKGKLDQEQIEAVVRLSADLFGESIKKWEDMFWWPRMKALEKRVEKLEKERG